MKKAKKNLGYKKNKLNPYVYSVLKPFKTEPIKPYFDYPLNTSLVEQTLEFTVNATLGNNAGLIPSGQYGAIVSIAPHAF